MKKLLLILVFASVAQLSVGQQLEAIEIDKRVFEIEYQGDDRSAKKAAKNAYKDAWEQVEIGDSYFAAGPLYYRDALKHYLKANEYNPNNAKLNYKIAHCYFFTTEKEKTIEFLEKAQQLNPKVSPLLNFFMGRAYHLNYKFDKAIEKYNAFMQVTEPELLEQFIQIKGDPAHMVQQCRIAQKLIKKPRRVFIDNIGSVINSEYPEYSPIISADESMMMFTSRRPNSQGGLQDGKYFEDIYVTYNKDGVWQPPVNTGKPINSKDHDATVGLSPDGQILLIYKGSSGNGDLFGCYLSGGEWSKPKPFSRKINTRYHESSASISPDGQKVYFVTNAPKESYGGHDIFEATLNEKGDWDNPVNLGKTINTEFEEDAPFIHPDGRTLYFSSQGHGSMGGFDIFRSVRDENGNWSKPENLGFPINTPEDDVFFVISADGKHGYFSSSKEGGYGEKDIYLITFLGAEKPLLLSNEDQLIASIASPVKEQVKVESSVELKKVRLTILKGTITDSMSGKPVQANIEIVDNEKNKVIATFKSNSQTGRYLLSLPSGKNYGIAVNNPNYLFHSENFNIPQAQSYQEITKDIKLLNLSKGSKVVLRNIFFDFNKATLRSESTAELERVKKLLNDYPTMKVEISGHTDNVGTMQYNKSLSRNRAKAVVDYLITEGIDASRLTFEGYAYTQPIATNDTEEGRQLNRRVEFKVVER